MKISLTITSRLNNHELEKQQGFQKNKTSENKKVNKNKNGLSESYLKLK